MKNEVRQTVRLPEDLYQKLQKMAEKEARSINGQIIASLRQTITEYEREHGSLNIISSGTHQGIKNGT